MISPEPFDSPTDPVTWVRLGLLTFGGLIAPLVMPRPFRPLTADAEPSPFETASLFSRYTFSYLDSIVFHAYRTSNVTINDMPQIPASEKIEVIGERVLSKFDPVRVGKRRIIWGVLRMWRSEFLIMSTLKVLQVFVDFARPFALRQLLGYVFVFVLESRDFINRIVFEKVLGDWRPCTWPTSLDMDFRACCCSSHFGWPRCSL